MRIDAYNQISQLYKTNNAKKTTKTSSAAATDKVQISQTGIDYQTAKTALGSTSDVREDKINSIAQALQSGTYNVSSQEIADKMVSHYFDSTY